MTDVEELGYFIKKVLRWKTLQGKFSSIHPELRREGIIRVEVEKEGLRFIRDSGALILIQYKKLTSGEAVDF